MAMFSSEQKAKLVHSVKALQEALNKREKADRDLTEKMNQVKTTGQVSGANASELIAQAHQIMGQWYVENPPQIED